MAVVSSIVLNGGLAAVKIAAGLVGSSYALIADGIESLNDVLTSGVVLFSLRVAAIPPDREHPFGHGRAEQLGALFSALSLLGAGALIAAQSALNLFHRHEAPAWWTLPILGLVIVVKELLSRYVLKKSDETGSGALRGDAWHHRSDAITSAAAAFGITVSLIGGPGFEIADDAAALIGCAVIGYNGVKLLRGALHDSMAGAPLPEVQDHVRQLAEAVPGVAAIEKLRMMKLGLGYYIDIHVQVEPTLSIEEGHRISHEVQSALLCSGLNVNDVVTHLEPFSATARSENGRCGERCASMSEH